MKTDHLTRLQIERIKLQSDLKETEGKLAGNFNYLRENAGFLLAKSILNSPKLQQNIKRELSNFIMGFVQGAIPVWLASEGGGTAKKFAAKAFSWISEMFSNKKEQNREKDENSSL